jgi:hypothetical protein
MSKLLRAEVILLHYLAQNGSAVVDHYLYRRLWYRGLTKWISPTEMALSDKGSQIVTRMMYEEGNHG